MRLGFDIDDTLIDLRRHAFHLYNETFQQQFSDEIFEAITRLEIHEPFGLTDAEGYEAWKSHLEKIYFTTCPQFDDAATVLTALAAEGHEIFYITARPKDYCIQSKAWMIAQGFPVKEGHFFCGMEDHEKQQIIENLQLDFYVDDKPKVLETLRQSGAQLLLRTQPYNITEQRFERLQHLQELAVKIK